MLVLFYYSIAMFTLPFIAFFATKHVCEDILYYNIFTTNVMSVISAVIVVNVIIFFYVHHEMRKNAKAAEEAKED